MANMIPTVHLNGTDGAELEEGYRVAAAFVLAARRQVEATAPNGRDYYVQHDGAYAAAEREHRARREKLLDVQRELEALQLAVGRQRRPR